MTLDHVSIFDRAFGAAAFVLLIAAAPVATAIFLSQSL